VLLGAVAERDRRSGRIRECAGGYWWTIERWRLGLWCNCMAEKDEEEEDDDATG